MKAVPLGPEKAVRVKVCRKKEAVPLKSLDERIAMHQWTERLILAVSELPAGGKSSLDPGHKGADEVAYVVAGSLEIEFPSLQARERLQEGDSILIPESLPHVVHNPGKKTAISIWATAPHLGYDLEELTG